MKLSPKIHRIKMELVCMTLESKMKLPVVLQMNQTNKLTKY